MGEPRQLSRGQFLARLLRPVQKAVVPPFAALGPAGHPAALPAAPVTPPLAAIIARSCLAFQGSLCTTCLERCPVPGALIREGHVPRVVPHACTGCGVCAALCPSPTPAILMVQRPRGLRNEGRGPA